MGVKLDSRRRGIVMKLPFALLFSAIALSAEAAEAQGPVVPQRFWQRTGDGSGIHQQSKLRCPSDAGGFRLTEVLANDAFGLDVGCTYEHATADRITLSLARNNRDHSFAANLEQSVFSVYFENAIIQTARETLPQFDTPTTWLGAFYRYGETPMRTGVWLTDFFGWTLKFRADFPLERQAEVLAALQALTVEARASAGEHGQSCTALPAPDRAGVRITDPMRIKDLIAAAGPAMAMEYRVQAAPVWCAEDAVNDAMGPFLLARAASNERDRFAWMAIDDPPVFDIVLQTPSQQAAAAAIYRIEVPFEGKLMIFGFFEGRPAPAAAMPLVRGSFIGVNPVGIFDPRTARMQIPRTTP
jgi:hypothetical protein